MDLKLVYKVLIIVLHVADLPVFCGFIDVIDEPQHFLSQALFYVVADLARLFTDHRKYGRPNLAKYKHFTTI